MAAVPVALITVPWIEVATPFANPIRRIVALAVFVSGFCVSYTLDGFSTQPLWVWLNVNCEREDIQYYYDDSLREIYDLGIVH